LGCSLFWGTRRRKGRGNTGYLLRDPVMECLVLITHDSGQHWTKQKYWLRVPLSTPRAFAGKQFSIIISDLGLFLVQVGLVAHLRTQFPSPRFALTRVPSRDESRREKRQMDPASGSGWKEHRGIGHLLNFRSAPYAGAPFFSVIVAVGGDYTKPTNPKALQPVSR